LPRKNEIDFDQGGNLIRAASLEHHIQLLKLADDHKEENAMYKTVLVPIDMAHPERGKPMIDVARQIGDKDARILLVSVVEEVPTFVASQLPKGLLENARELAAEELKAIANAAGKKPDYQVRSGNASNAILDIAKEQDVDIILIGSHKPGLQDYLLGSTAARVVRHAECTVLVAR
jgi:nucleotide-binding universal stress UspA family protein